MLSYNRIPIWQNIRRTKLLLNFKALIIAYFNSTQVDPYRREVIETDKSPSLRTKINLALNKVSRVMRLSGVPTSIYYSPPPITGGLAGEIDLIQNIFNLHIYRIDVQQVIDVIERSIGIYRDDRFNSIARTVNPFFWIGFILDFIVNLPFKILGKVGFNQKRVESSFIGKLMKGLLYLITVFSSLLTIFHYLGWLESFRRVLNNWL